VKTLSEPFDVAQGETDNYLNLCESVPFVVSLVEP